MKTTIEEIRAALVRSSEGVGRPYPVHIRTAALAHVERRKRAGVGLETSAAEIGVSIGAIAQVTAAALVTAGLVSVVAFPPLAIGLLAAEPQPMPDPLLARRPMGTQH